jgi:hypothetical protein
MPKKIYVTMMLDVSDEMFDKLSKNLTEEQKKYLDWSKMVPAPGLGFWNGNLVDYLETHKIDLHEFIEDLKANDNTVH